MSVKAPRIDDAVREEFDKECVLKRVISTVTVWYWLMRRRGETENGTSDGYSYVYTYGC